jgi:hypothetical protein
MRVLFFIQSRHKFIKKYITKIVGNTTVKFKQRQNGLKSTS